ncbi:MAG: undecaprenyl-diphosphate phosphatase [Lentisphaeria bacterium]|nr:undecaprenyl-diphosphate phosphatase [Lentisphaeria bacterium]
MDFIKLQLLAIIQGLTEFLPVSSSGHLALLEGTLNLGKLAEGPLLEVLLHGGTLIAVLLFYKKRIFELVNGLLKKDTASWKYAMLVAISCVPAGIIYFLANDQIEKAFESPKIIAAFLMVTGVVLLSLRWKINPTGSKPSWLQALLIGVAQAFAILPGISRSGSTYTAARWLKVDSKEAFDFSFLASIPLILGAIVLKFRHFSDLSADGHLFGLLFATVVSAVVGYLALSLLAKIRLIGKFWVFGIYCLAAGAIALIFC